jgi:flagellar assembly protein FliH
MKREILESADAESLVFKYVPQQFPVVISKSAKNFIKEQDEKSSDFKISELIADQSGITEQKRYDIEKKVEEEALLKMKELQERAYNEAYQLGLIEGREKSFKDFNTHIENRLTDLDEVLNSILHLRKILVDQNEEKIINLVNRIASKIAFKEINSDNSIILEVIRTVYESAQSEEGVTIRLSPEDDQFIKDSLEKLGPKFDFIKNVKFEIDNNISKGGCVLETKYGSIDASVEQRFQKSWSVIESRISKVKNAKNLINSSDTNSMDSDLKNHSAEDKDDKK